MLSKFLALLPLMLKGAALVATFLSGKKNGRIKQLEAEVATLRDELARLNARPITDDDVIGVLHRWSDGADGPKA